MNWGTDTFRNLFAAIDSIVYSLVSIIYEILMQISKFNLFGNDAFEGVAGKIYTLLGVFMLFKVTFSFISYLVHPDDLSDKAKGAQKIILNILLVFAMIILAPTAFEKLYEAQSAIVQDNVIAKLILGQENANLSNRHYQMSDVCPADKTSAATDGDYIAIMIFRPFYQIIDGASDDIKNAYCGEGNDMTVSKYLDLAQVDASSGVSSIFKKLVNAAQQIMIPGIQGAQPQTTITYTIDYKFLMSTIVGIVVLLVLISFCFDVAIRSIKLGFLQIIAPIPIISYVDPKSGKDGMFKKWLKEVGKTWADLFVRLVALYFAVYIIQLMDFTTMDESIEKYKFWVMLFIIIGALMFAKKLPKLVEDILGIKLDSGFTLNPMKKIRDNALGEKLIADMPKKTVGLGAGLAGGMIAGAMAGKQVGATGKGLVLGALGGAKNGFKNPKEAFSKGMREEFKNLTGNEMARLSVSKIMLSSSGAAAVKETKDALSIAYSNLNDKQTELNVSEHTTASLAESLRSQGYDVSRMADSKKLVEERKNAQLKKLNEMKSNSTKYSESYKAAQEEYQKISRGVASGIVGVDGNPVYSQEHLSAAKAKMEQSEKEYNNYLKQVQEGEILFRQYQQSENALNTYQDNKVKEAGLRDEISKIQKNIETIKAEKAQRERFYQVDKSPQKDYKDAINQEMERHNKLKGMDE